MEILRWILTSGLMFAFGQAALAKDSQELSKQRRQIYAGIDFYCQIGRQPIATSDQAWAIQPSAACSFNGPLDTKINRLSLQPPVLKPWLTMAELGAVLQARGARFDDGAIELPSGTRLMVRLSDYRDLADNLMKLAAYPVGWSSPFITINADRAADITEFVAFTAGSDLFWTNPYVREETSALPRLQGDRPYLPVNLVSKCNDEWKTFGGAQSLLLVGDLHSAKETDYFTQLVQQRSFAFVALEMASNWQSFIDDYFATKDPVAEASDLAFLVSRHSKDVQASAKAMFVVLKRLHVPVVLMDYQEDYFNFPYTSTGFHGLIMATRNSLWVNHLPASWVGTGALLGGVDHFAVTPNADFQNFALERFPALELGLVNPYEACL